MFLRVYVMLRKQALVLDRLDSNPGSLCDQEMLRCMTLNKLLNYLDSQL